MKHNALSVRRPPRVYSSQTRPREVRDRPLLRPVSVHAEAVEPAGSRTGECDLASVRRKGRARIPGFVISEPALVTAVGIHYVHFLIASIPHGVGSVPVADEHNLSGAGHRCRRDRKSTRLNSSHLVISYAVFRL